MDKFAMTPKGVRLLLCGLVVMIAGYILMTGPVPVKETFNYDMFGWQRLVAAPVVIVCGIIIEVLAIMRKEDK